MKTTLDEFSDELEILFKKYGYTISSMKEEIDHNVRPFYTIYDGLVDVHRGAKMIVLEVNAVRVGKL